MDEPTYSAEVENIWNSIPEMHREMDEQYDWQFKRFIASIVIGGGYEAMRQAVNRFLYIAPYVRGLRVTSDRKPGLAPIQTVQQKGVYPPDPSVWEVHAEQSEIVATQLRSVEGYVEYELYLQGGRYALQFNYVKDLALGGIAEVVIDGKSVGTINTSIGIDGTNQSIEFPYETPRGYTNIKLWFRPNNQPSMPKLLQLGEMTVKPEAVGYNYSTSDLVNPASAEPEWLAWLAQFVGVALPANTPASEARATIASANQGFRAGTKAAIAEAVRPMLTGSRSVSVFDHSATRETIGEDSMWDILIITRATETPVDLDVVAELAKLSRVKPAGCVFHHDTYTATWLQQRQTYPYWIDRRTVSWAQLAEAGLY